VRIRDRDQEHSEVTKIFGQSNYVPSACGRHVSARLQPTFSLIVTYGKPCGFLPRGLFWHWQSLVKERPRLQEGHDPRKILVGCDEGCMVPFPTLLHEVTQLHLTSWLVDDACVCPGNRGH
jgi:hypothetical protein